MAKRVLIYTNHFFPENFKVNEIASMLSEDGLDVTVITGIPNYPEGKIPEGYGYFKRRKEFVDGVRVKRLWLIPRGSGSKLRLIINYLSYFISCLFYTFFIGVFKKKYDVVFVHHTSPILIAIPPILYKWLRKPKMILWDLDMWPDTLVALDIIKSKKLIAILEGLVKWIYKQYDAVLIGSKSFAEKAKNRVDASKIEYFPNWAEDVFIEKNSIKPEGNHQFPDGFKLMYAGNIGEAQDFGNICNAMNLLRNEDVNWLIVGGGRWFNQLKEKVSNSGLDDKVTYYGNNPLATMPYFFSQADVMFFSLQDKEIFSKTVPAKLQAYMASGKPVIGMISGEGNDIIKEASCGISVLSGDYESFADAILQLKSQKENLQKLGENGSDFYSKYFSKQARKKQLVKLIQN
ncbi:glycosyltransferase family 4 protein [Winogradskyella sp.]|uniref:glycosyltransferase family 4 protein n=1 Tax=Winogradskyella sp. TaxID=1883156 RepID=UPI003AB388FA